MAPWKWTTPLTLQTAALAAPKAPFDQPGISVNLVEPAFASAGASSAAHPATMGTVCRIPKNENIFIDSRKKVGPDRRDRRKLERVGADFLDRSEETWDRSEAIGQVA